MAERIPIPLTPTPIALDHPDFQAISGWPYADPFVSRILRDDIPQRIRFGNSRIWTYRDPEGRLVGFGTLDVSDDFAELTDGEPHPYIPLLAVNPTIKSLGYGTTIVRHLIAEAVLMASRGTCCDLLILDVYTTGVKAIEVYTDCGFVRVTNEPIPDLQESGKPYIVMGKRVSVASAATEIGRT